MMGYWQQWLRLLVGLVMVISLFDMLLPEHDLKKLAKHVLGLVIMLALLQPLLAIIYGDWETLWGTILPTVPEIDVDWQAAGNAVFTAGFQPMKRVVSSNANQQIEQLLRRHSLIKDARVAVSIADTGEVIGVHAEIVPFFAADLSPSEWQNLQEDVIKIIADYLQISERLIFVNIT